MKFIPVFAKFPTFTDSPRQPYIKAHDMEYDLMVGERYKYYEREKEKFIYIEFGIIHWNWLRLALRMTKTRKLLGDLPPDPRQTPLGPTYLSGE